MAKCKAKKVAKKALTIDERVLAWFHSHIDSAADDDSAPYYITDLDGDDTMEEIWEAAIAGRPVTDAKTYTVSIRDMDKDKVRSDVEDSCLSAHTKKSIIDALK